MKYLIGNIFILLFISTKAIVKKQTIDKVQLSYLNNKKVQNFIQDPTNTFAFLSTSTNQAETSRRKPIDTLIKFLRSITPPKDLSINNQCWSSPCKNGAQCFGSSHSYLCVCLKGYTGLNCAEILTNHKECAAEFCNNNGYCQIKALSLPKANLRFCNCDRGFTGQHCEIEIRSSIQNRVTPTSTSVMSILNPTRTILLTFSTASTRRTASTTTTATTTTEAEKLYKKLSNINKTKKPHSYI